MRARQWLTHLLDFCYPPTCAACGELAQAATILCDSCDGALSDLEHEPACDRCGKPRGIGAACPFCHGRGLRPIEKIVRLARFDEPLKQLIHLAKYHRRWSAAEAMADRLLESENAKGLLTHTQRIVPVPLYHWRRVARGYNQADVVARRLGSRCGISVVQPTARWRPTETQTHLHSHAKRLANLRDAFVLTDERAIRGQHVVLIDDVLTTGATLQALARTVIAAKPASLCAIVLAVADPKNRQFQRV